HAYSNPSLTERLAPLFERPANASSSALTLSSLKPAGLPFDAGGSGLFTTARDYFRLLSTLHHNDGRVLQP
ncbi:hypothetical protein L0P50_19755, partial [Lawsonibacter sp. DFI.6.74]|nr:hypothetical protein [Lawsonibacter sp. DFI.6.74]